MFSERKIIRRYANVFFEYSNKNSSIYRKIKNILLLLSENFELSQVLYTQLLSPSKKINILKKSLFDPFIFHFIKILILRKRESFTKEIFLEYKRIYKEKKGFLKCILTTSCFLDKRIQENIVKKIFSSEIEFRNKKYHILNKKDPSIIGGFILHVGYKEWDFSIKGKFFNLKKIFNNY
ncbi:F0F1 ATP synthase subunit delta [Blattabacterium cuenoti]|uniref:F0F1 ATP synthase subunit delta n=1 Tax=Blattabacterium cuenoti TaxID=1653831 RepID=UPI00163C9E66|nr:F0F1 ATP synthase subunit delta [Blattabacterium cuenoti]